jgi:hypothetical protein
MKPLGIAALLVLAACSGSGPTPAPSNIGNGAVGSSPPVATPLCTPAPEWLVRDIQSSIKLQGAKLSDAFIMPASSYVMGPPIVLSSKFMKSWWVGGRINGAGVDNEVATWVTNGTSASNHGLTFAVSAAARRYSDLGADVQDDIAGDGEVAVRSCVG